MPIKGRRPYTEMVEVAQNELVREKAIGEEAKYQGFINQVYLNELPSLLPERYIKKEGFVLTVANYTTGTVTVGSGTSLIQGVSTAFTSANDDSLIRVDGFDEVYRVTYSANTLMTSSASLTWTGASGSGNSYNMYKDRYQLATDFAYMAQDNPEDPNIVYRYLNGARVFLDPITNEESGRRENSVIGTLYAYTVKWIEGVPYLYLQSGPEVAENVGFEYIPVLNAMVEYTVGTITLTTGTAVVSGLTTPQWTSLDSTETYYLRNDADGTGSASKWTKILTFVNDTALTLASSFAFTSGAAIVYTIASISRWPERFDDAMIYKTAMLVDPDNIQTEKWGKVYTEAVGLDKAVEARRNQGGQLKDFGGAIR